MFSVILPFLKSKLAALGAIVVIVLVIAIGGPMVLGSRWRLWCYLAAAAILVIFLLYLLVKALRARKKARLLEGFLKKQADDQLLSARPDVKDELTAIREKLDRALAVLKRSRLGRGKRGDQALYVLPWYMIIGPSAAGKSTALRNSGLHFPPVDPEAGEAGKVKGLGGTRNCDWWFSNEGIILDTAGRYTLSATGADDREEWSSFLAILKKARPRAPINGLILAVAVDEVLKKSDDEREELAKNLRRRIDELIGKLEILFPIYVVFTKCDLIGGFVEFFGGLSRIDREQIWGYTRKYEPSTKPLHEEFAREAPALLAVLERRRLRQLATEIRPTQRRGTYLFPLEFAATVRPLTAFVETLFAPNPYQQNPLVRGFYFTSGTQEGTPIGQVMAAMRRDFGLEGAPRELSEPPGETKAYFIRDLFGEIILPDELNVVATTAAGRRLRGARLWAISAMAATTGLLCLAFLTSYLGNRRANTHMRAVTSHVASVTGATGSFSLDALDSLDVLRETLQRADAGPSLWRRWGLYSGEAVLAAARQVYFKRYHDLFLAPSARELEVKLRRTPTLDTEEGSNRYFQTATAYQMLTLHHDSVSPDIGALTAETDSLWSAKIGAADHQRLEYLLQSQIPYYWKHRRDSDLRWLRTSPDRGLLYDIDRVMANFWDVGRLYRKVINDANAALGGYYTMLEAAPGQIRLSGGQIGRAFTADGFAQQVEKRIDTMPDEIAANPVLKNAFAAYSTDWDRLRRELTDRYAAEFRSSWRAFIDAATVLPLNDLTEATAALTDLSPDNTPMIGLLKKVYDQGKLDIGGKAEQEIKTEFEPLGRFLGEIKSDDGGDTGQKTYLKLLSELPKTVQETRDLLQTQAQCALRLHQLKSGLESRRSQIQRLIGGSSLARSAAAFLIRPLDAARAAAFGEVCTCLNRQWEAAVYKDFQTNLEGVYPFNRGSENEAPIDQVVQFFTGSGGIFAFDQAEGQAARTEGINLSGEYQNALSVGEELRRAMPGRNLSVAFTLTATSRNLTGLRMLRFEYGTNRFEFAMGQDESRSFKWPQPGADQASLSVIAINEALYATPKRFTGPWALLRLFDDGTASGTTVSWGFSASGQTITARYDLSGAGAEFLRSGHFSRFRCPPRICP